jgi:hypothetical protein
VGSFGDSFFDPPRSFDGGFAELIDDLDVSCTTESIGFESEERPLLFFEREIFAAPKMGRHNGV